MAAIPDHPAMTIHKWRRRCIHICGEFLSLRLIYQIPMLGQLVTRWCGFWQILLPSTISRRYWNMQIYLFSDVFLFARSLRQSEDLIIWINSEQE